MKKSKMLSKAKIKIADTVKLPRDLSRGETLLSVTGHEEVYIENYKGILVCTKELIKLSSGTGIIEIYGNNLVIKYYTDEEMKITGRILKILFL